MLTSVPRSRAGAAVEARLGNALTSKTNDSLLEQFWLVALSWMSGLYFEALSPFRLYPRAECCRRFFGMSLEC
jgi:hypothetical protein